MNNLQNINTINSGQPIKIHNIGNFAPDPLMEYIAAIENTLGKTAQK